eukprot:Transcript_9178.p2 GENE.Transcript_9178~~Transcript_9178.p2  ORF type:complete len:387 (-),score=166.81 Transcript_9178:75-1235(-)
MSTPAPKRARRAAADEDAASGARTRKAPRVAAAAGSSSRQAAKSVCEPRSLSATLLELTAEIRAWRERGQDPSERELELLKSASHDLRMIVAEQRKEERERERRQQEEALDETPLSFDMLAQALSWLSGAELAVAARTSKHFRRVAPEAVRLHLERLVKHAGRPFRRQEMCIDLLKQVEQERKRVPAILSQISRNTIQFSALFDELQGMLPQVLASMAPLIVAKMRELRRIGKGDDPHDELPMMRDGMMLLLDQASISQRELVDIEKDVLDHLEGEKNSDDDIKMVTGAMSLIRRMPAAVIEKRISTVMWWLTNGAEGDAHDALEGLASLSPETLASLNVKAAIAAAPLANSKNRDIRNQLSRLVRSIPGDCEPPSGPRAPAPPRL